MAATILTALYLLGIPLIVMLLGKRWKWIDKASPMTVLYVVGLLFANLLPADNGIFNIDDKTNTLISNLAVPLAIPLMLMGCNTGGWQIGKAMKVFLSGLLSVIVVIVTGFFLFRPEGDPKGFAQVSAVATGLYTGGIPNTGAIKQGVGMSEELFLYVTGYDLIVTGLYLVFIILFGKSVFRKLLPVRNRRSRSNKTEDAVTDSTTQIDQQEEKVNPFDRAHIKVSLLAIGITLVIAAVSYLVSLLASKDGEPNMTVLILLLTTLAIGASFLPSMHKQQHSFDIGLYCVYVFSLSIASACNLRTMDLAGSISILYYLCYIIIGSLVLQFLLARLLKIDGDSVMVCSIALINSPPFVPMAAAILKNRDVVVLGIAVGLLGYMLGNYLGIGIFHLLMAIG